MRWDLFCHVVDNFGDIGVCWRLAADLAARGQAVRLWTDDSTALAWMAPAGAPSVSVLPWDTAHADDEPGDVVIEAFGCNLPARFVQRMAARVAAPVWINLEYLSAEPAVERLHGLPSPQLAGPGKGLTKWFYYPGLSAATGGLIREPDLMAVRQRFDLAAWLRRHGIEVRADERRVSLFCYDNPALPELIATLSNAPTLLLATAGWAAQQVQEVLGPTLRTGALRAVLLPWLSQPDFDALLWSCDLNFVRGEDSFVRAQWAGKPFVWQIYPQSDGAHEAKLEAFMDRLLASADKGLAGHIRQGWRRWNGLTDDPLVGAELFSWRGCCEQWRAGLLQQPDLTEQLLRFVAERR